MKTRSSLRIPRPAHPTERRQPLPWQRPKAVEEEGSVEARLRAIMHDPAYLEADRDMAFLHSDVAQASRLQLDFLKSEMTLRKHGIRHTIVVFGSTRLREPATAARELEALRDELGKTPADDRLRRALRLAQQRLEMSKYYQVGHRLGQLVAEAGSGPQDSRLVVMTGGGPGGMEAANRGAFEVSAKTVGLNITLPNEQFPNPYLTPGLCFQFHYFAIRKLHFMLRARALVALPGGYGTLDELFTALALIQTRKVHPLPIVLIGESYWRRVLDVDYLVEMGVIDEEDTELFWYADSAEEAWEGICLWHEINGTDLFGGSEEATPEPPVVS